MNRGQSTAGILGCYHLADPPVQPTCVITSNTKDWLPRINYLRTSDTSLSAVLYCLLLSHRKGVATAYAHNHVSARVRCALRTVYVASFALRTAHAVAEQTSLVPYMSKAP